MSRALRPDDMHFADEGDDPFLLVAATAHVARNVEAFSDFVVAALHGAGDANTHILCSGADALGEQIAAAAAMAGARTPYDLLAAQHEFSRRAVETYAISAQILRILLVASAKAAREPLLERLR